MSDFELTCSIIYDCPAINLPQSFLEELGHMRQIAVLKGVKPEMAQFIADACNEKLQREPKP